MRKRIILAVLAALAVATVAVAVVILQRSDDTEDREEIQLQPDAQVIEDPSEITSYDYDTGELTTTSDVEPGTVLVAGVTPATPEGLLVRVEALTDDGTVLTTPAKLTDVITETDGTITLEGVPATVDVQTAPGVTYLPNVSGGGGAGTFSPLFEGELAHSLNLDLPILEKDGHTLANLAGKVEAGVNATMELDIGLRDGLRHIEATINPKITSELVVDSTQEWEGSKTRELGNVRHTWVFMAGPVPVVMSSSLALAADIEASVSAQLTLKSGTSSDLLVGYRHDSDSAEDSGPIFEQSSSMDAPTLTGSVVADVDASVAATIEAKFYGVVGMHGRAGPYAQLNASLDLVNGLSCTWGGGARGEVGASVGIEALGPDAVHEWTTDGTWPRKDDQVCPGFRSLPPIALTVGSIAEEWTVGEDIPAVTLSAAGGNAETMTYTLRGDVPPGVALRADGAAADLSGAPTSAGTYTFTLVAADGSGMEDTAEVTVVVREPLPPPPPLVHVPSDAIGAAVGYQWGMPIIFSGGRGPYTYTAENLPPGLELVPADEPPTIDGRQIGTTQAFITGVPQRAGDWESSVTVTDSTGQSLEVPVSLGAVDPPDPLPPGWGEMYPSP